MDELGVRDPEAEFGRWLEERGAILEMNHELNRKPSRGRVRERDTETPDRAGEE
jgi:hypothetical protein